MSLRKGGGLHSVENPRGVGRRLRRLSNAALRRHMTAGLVSSDGVHYQDARGRQYHIDELVNLPAGVRLLDASELPGWSMNGGGVY